MRKILVSAEDPVLANKVHLLLQTEECLVQMVDTPEQLTKLVELQRPSMLVISRNFAGQDALHLLKNLIHPEIPSIVLGGSSTSTEESWIKVIPDPIDIQVVYREASQLLDSDNTTPSEDKMNTPAIAETRILREDVVTNQALELVEIAHKLNLVAEKEVEEQLTDAFNEKESVNPVLDQITTNGTSEAMDQNQRESLDPASFAKALYNAWSGEATGALIVQREDNEILTIYINSGQPVWADSSLPGQSLGKDLVGRGKITESQYGNAAKRAIEHGITLGKAFIDLSYLSEDELNAELATSARELVVACFAAQNGQFFFDKSVTLNEAKHPFDLEVGHVITQGLKAHATDQLVDRILTGEVEYYFRLKHPIEELIKTYPLSERDRRFLAFESKAYNIPDAAENSGLPLSDARRLVATLLICDEVTAFTPGVAEFEARIKEEKSSRQEAESKLPSKVQIPAPITTRSSGATLSSLLKPEAEPEVTPPVTTDAADANDDENESKSAANVSVPEDEEDEKPDTSGFSRTSSPTLIGTPPVAPVAPSVANGIHSGAEISPPAAPLPVAAPAPIPPPDADIPPMPVPAVASEGTNTRTVVYAKPLPKGPDGATLETAERTLSREHFQRGVTLLGKGSFAAAEEAFRDAVSLCAEEHVYLIGLARSIYYNANYHPEGKIPVLQSIVGRALDLAPDDKRVAALKSWVDYAALKYLPN